MYKGNERERCRREIMRHSTSGSIQSNYYQAIITTYDYAMSDKAFFRKFVFESIIVDEASRIKNCRSKLIGVLRDEITCKFRLLLSGTPLQNNIKELFTLLQFIHGSVFNSFEQFDAVFGKIITRVIRDRDEDDPLDDQGPDASDTEDNTNIEKLKESDLESECRLIQTPAHEEQSLTETTLTSPTEATTTTTASH